MGMYTAFHFRAYLKPDTPKEVLDILRSMVEDGSFPEDVGLPSHPFFNTDRGDVLFRMSSMYHPYSTPVLVEDKIESTVYHYTLIVNSSLKNYDNEIEKFVDWITPYLLSEQNVAYSLYEEDENPRFLLPVSAKS